MSRDAALYWHRKNRRLACAAQSITTFTIPIDVFMHFFNRLLVRLERKLGRFAVPNITIALIIGQIVVYAMSEFTPPQAGQEPVVLRLMLIPNLVLAGEVWRLVTFLAIPPITNIIFAFFFWYLFYLMGTALEHFWGAFRYNIYLLVGYLATVAVSFLIPEQAASNGYLQGSVFLAFAFLYPNFELYLFFILPVKIKWLAMFTWIGYFLMAAVGDAMTRLLVLASVCNFLLFFVGDIWDRVKTGRRRMATQAAHFGVKKRDYFHRCVVCGITDRTHPDMEFRYCSECVGSCGYCTEHVHNHEHVTADEKPAEKV